MALILLIFLITIPLVELYVLIAVGGSIGGLNVVLLSLLTAAVGLSIVRSQGRRLMTDLAGQTGSTLTLGDAIVHGVFLLIAGAMLMFPGLITDVIGGLLLIPPVRLLLGRLGLAGVVAARMQTEAQRRYSGSRDDSGVVIEGEIISAQDRTPSQDQHRDAPHGEPGRGPSRDSA